MYKTTSQNLHRMKRTGSYALMPTLKSDELLAGQDASIWATNKSTEEVAVARAVVMQDKLDLDNALSELKLRMKRMQRNARATGVYAHHVQYSDLEAQIREMGQKSQRLQMELGVLNKLMKEKKQEGLDRAFVFVAKMWLDADIFGKLMRLAEDRVSRDQPF